MTAMAVVLVLRAYLEVDSDHVDGDHVDGNRANRKGTGQ